MPLDFPPIYLLSTHLSPDELHRLEGSIPSLTYDIHEAQVVVGNISKTARAQFELRRLKLDTEPILGGALARGGGASEVAASVQVLKLSWLTDCLQRDTVLPTDDYLLYRGRRLDAGSSRKRPPSPATTGIPWRARRPLVPAYLHTTYSCQRPTPVHSPNAAFIEELKSIRTLRLLQGDQIGVRAYSTSIATLAAYPHPLRWSLEIARLPGCGGKIAALYQQWREHGQTKEAADAMSDPKLAVLKLFYGIWGVGDSVAREFYAKGWRNLDDVVEHGWASLSRAQQIGVKFYDELKLKIPRREVEAIAQIILSNARGIDAGFEMTIAGGHRRGKGESGDVDVVLSLERGGFITHTLSLWTRNSERGQIPLPWKGDGAGRGTGFDTLDKAMVVWQAPGSTTETEPTPHRRVDIIVSPWKTVGCALLGWSGGTTFQRDLRRYCKRELGLKFDSSGIRRQDTGEWVDLEGAGGDGASWDRGPAPDMETAEKRVFEGLGLPWRPPEERCTG
ncbi:DNA polymerase beta thumb domain-containing protein [Hirsutella rhossiliensis]|uniref:DNA polymerase n=1 Tax=Hirsutella rhossiliensis TaxID=111463 RepID=A0A9P8N4B4_9HYPO|nr:DNA polymerase beta thumb domain-containing protein [Hirsutella rhossiliensis]KAH0964422.1 DNA polymerase beta thumb domain-containing protein [Hirsutella rhossiliensis]